MDTVRSSKENTDTQVSHMHSQLVRTVETSIPSPTSNGVNALTVSLGRNILDTKSRERERMRTYAQYLAEFHIIVLTRKEHGYREVQHEGNLHVYPTNSTTRLTMLWDAFWIGRKIAREKRASPLVISAQDPFEIGFLCLLLSFYKNTQLHIQIHGDYFGSSYWSRNSALRQVRLWYARFILNHARGIRVVSERIKRSLILEGIDEARVIVLPIRPELEIFLNAPHEIGEYTQFTFLVASRFAPEKNIPLILRAFAKLAVRHEHIRLGLVGRGQEEKTIRACISELGISEKVTIIPWTETVEKEMQRADVFLVASDHEAYGLTLVEALAVGLPLVTTDVGCVGEVVKDGTHGIVVPVRDEEAYEKAMERMIIDVAFRTRCSEAGRKTAYVLAQTSSEEYAQAWVASLSLGAETV